MKSTIEPESAGSVGLRGPQKGKASMAEYEQEFQGGLGTALMEARTRHACAVESAFKQTSEGTVSSPMSMIASDPASASSLSSFTRDELTIEQYRHNRGRVHSAIKVPQRRVSAQPLFIARMLKRNQRSSRREFTLRAWIENADIDPLLVPGWIKQAGASNLEILEDHPIHDLIDSPSTFMTRSMLFDVLVSSWLITGRTLAMVTDNPDATSGTGHDLIAIPSTWGTPVHAGADLFSSWKVRPPASMEEPIAVPGGRMVHVAFADPSDPRKCLSPLQQNARAVKTDEAIDVAQHEIMNQGMFPTFAVLAGSDDPDIEGTAGEPIALTKEDRRKIYTWIKRELVGARRHGWPVVLDAIIRDVKRITNTPHEMGFAESSKMTKEKIYEAFTVNPISAGQVEGANRASSAIADSHFVLNAVNPLIEGLSQGLTRTVAPIFVVRQEKLKVWIALAEPHDPEMRLRKWESSKDRVTDNEWRQNVLNLPPYEGGDVIYRSGMMLPQIVSVKARGASPAAKSKGLNDQNDLLIQKQKETWIKQHGALETAFRADILEFFNQQINSAAKELEEFAGESKSPTSETIAQLTFDPRRWDEKLKETVKPHLIRGMGIGAINEWTSHHKQPAEEPGEEFDDIRIDLPDRVLTGIQSNLDELLNQNYWPDINTTTLKQLADAIEKGLTEGDNLRQIANRIKEVFPNTNTNRAFMIARTESTSTMNSGKEAAREELAREGVISKKEWLAIRDADVRDTHADLHRVQVEVGGNFDLGGYKVPYPAHFSLPASERIG